MKDMIGKTPIAIRQGSDEIWFTFSDETVCRFWHCQDCCESVTIEDVNGDWDDLIGTPLLVADERTGPYNGVEYYESATWTFYTFRSVKGSVDVRWIGESNGYYSETVDFGWVAK